MRSLSLVRVFPTFLKIDFPPFDLIGALQASLLYSSLIGCCYKPLSGVQKGKVQSCEVSILTFTNMATPIISDISNEQSELEGVVKLEPDEQELKSPQYV